MGSRAERSRERPAAIVYGDAPTLLLFGAEAALGKGRRAALAAGFRIVSEASSPEDAAALAYRSAPDAILIIDDSAASSAAIRVALEGMEGEACAPMVVALANAAEPGHVSVGKSVTRWHVGDDGLSLLQALHEVAAPVTIRFHDAKNHGGPRLQQLSEEVGRIATILASLSEDDSIDELERDDGLRIDAALVRSVIRVRRLRDHYFRSAMFADPAWDMLLDLFAARLERQRVAVSSLCIAAAVPATTALRWIKTMTDQGLFVRVADPQDGRRVFIELSDEAATGLETYLRAAQRISPLIV